MKAVRPDAHPSKLAEDLVTELVNKAVDFHKTDLESLGLSNPNAKNNCSAASFDVSYVTKAQGAKKKK